MFIYCICEEKENLYLYNLKNCTNKFAVFVYPSSGLRSNKLHNIVQRCVSL